MSRRDNDFAHVVASAQSISFARYSNGNWNTKTARVFPSDSDDLVKFDTAAQKVDAAAGDLKGTFTDIRKVAGSAGKALESARSLLNNASYGRGALGLLMSDKETGENLKEFIRNLKERGVLWYKDKPK